MLSYREAVDDRMVKASWAHILKALLCVGLTVRVCIASFWKAGSR